MESFFTILFIGKDLIVFLANYSPGIMAQATGRGFLYWSMLPIPDLNYQISALNFLLYILHGHFHHLGHGLAEEAVHGIPGDEPGAA